MLIENGFEILVTSPELFWILAVLSVLAVSISKSGFGGAMGAFSVPIFLFALPPKLALGVLLPLFLVTDLWVVYIWRHMLDKRILLVMSIFGLLGEFQTAMHQQNSNSDIIKSHLSNIFKRY